MFFSAVATTASLFLISAGVSNAAESGKDYEHVKRVNKGLNSQREFAPDLKPISACKTSENPSVLVWGGSYAMHLVPGIVGSGADGVVQATCSLCEPFIGLAPLAPQRGYNEKWAEGCISFNDSVFEYLKSAESVKIVVLSSPFGGYLNSSTHNLKRNSLGSGFEVVNGGGAVALDVMKSTIDKLHSIGKKVVIVAPPPSGGFDMGLCAERMDAGRITMGSTKGCKFGVDAYHKISSGVSGFLKEVSLTSNINISSFEDYLCKGGYCSAYVSGVFIC